MAWYRNAFLGRLLAASLLAVPGARAALWVAAGGDDRNPGSEELPLRTLGRARDLVRTLNRDQADDLTVFIAGRYFLERPLEFGPGHEAAWPAEGAFDYAFDDFGSLADALGTP